MVSYIIFFTAAYVQWRKIVWNMKTIALKAQFSQKNFTVKIYYLIFFIHILRKLALGKDYHFCAD